MKQTLFRMYTYHFKILKNRITVSEDLIEEQTFRTCFGRLIIAWTRGNEKKRQLEVTIIRQLTS